MQSSARNIVKEMEAHKLCVTTTPEYDGNQRKDAKTWTQAVAQTQAQQAAR